MNLTQWLQKHDRTPEEESLWDEELPDTEELTEDWATSVTPAYADVLEAEPVYDDKPGTLANTIAAGIMLTQWLFDRNKGQLLKPKTREPLAQVEADLVLSDRVADSKQRLGNVAKRYERTQNIAQWEKQATEEIRRIHSEAYLLGRGGINAIDERDLEILNTLLKEQAKFLQQFKAQLATGNLSELQAYNRLRSYAQSANMTYWEGKERAIASSNYKQERWVLGDAEHCDGCVEQSGLGFVRVGTLPAIGSQECVFNCKCRKEYR